MNPDSSARLETTFPHYNTRGVFKNSHEGNNAFFMYGRGVVCEPPQFPKQHEQVANSRGVKYPCLLVKASEDFQDFTQRVERENTAQGRFLVAGGITNTHAIVEAIISQVRMEESVSVSLAPSHNKGEMK